MNNIGNSLVEGLERLGLMASRIRKNEGDLAQIEIDVILQELRNLYVAALKAEQELSTPAEDLLAMDLKVAAAKAEEEKSLAEKAAAKKAAEEKRLAEEAAAKKAAEEKRLAEEAAAKKAAEEKRLAEEAAAKKAAEEKRLAEEAAAKKAAEEKRLAEEAAAKKAAEEKRLAEEAAAKKAAEEKRLAEEAAAKKRAAEAALAAAASKLNPIFAQETTAQGQQQATPQMETLAGNPNDALFAEPAAEAEQPKREMSLFDLLSPKSDATEGPAKRTLADTLGKQMPNVEDKLENHVRAKKVDDLRTIIGINDKFAFMNNLFNSNMRAYNDFVLHLNAINDREEALEYVNIIAQEYKWDETSDDVIRFHKIFDRKF